FADLRLGVQPATLQISALVDAVGAFKQGIGIFRPPLDKGGYACFIQVRARLAIGTDKINVDRDPRQLLNGNILGNRYLAADKVGTPFGLFFFEQRVLNDALDHPLIDELAERLLGGHDTDIEQKLMPE